MDRNRFSRVIAEGFGVESGDVHLVLVDRVGGDAFACGQRVGVLARLLSVGADWDDVTAATGFALEVRAAAEATTGLMVELGRAVVPLDLFAVAVDPLGAVQRLFSAAGGFG